MHSRVIIQKLRADGWYLYRVRGSHHHLRHPEKPGTVTVVHPKRDTPVGTVRSIERRIGIKLR